MKIFIVMDSDRKIHITDNIELLADFDWVRSGEHDFPGRREVVFHFEDGCENCGKPAELYHNETLGIALCEACDMLGARVIDQLNHDLVKRLLKVTGELKNDLA